MKVLLVAAEFFRAEGRMDRQTNRQTNTTKLIVTFYNFVHAPKTNIYIKPNTQIYPVDRM